MSNTDELTVMKMLGKGRPVPFAAAAVGWTTGQVLAAAARYGATSRDGSLDPVALKAAVAHLGRAPQLPERAGPPPVEPLPATSKRCSKCGVVKLLGEFTVRTDRASGYASACKACERARAAGQPREYTPTRAVYNRARQRATQRLVKLHAAEFERLMAEEIPKARAELEAFQAPAPAAEPPPKKTAAKPTAVAAGVPKAKAAHAHVPPPTPLLRPGPRPAGQTAADRVRDDVGRCPLCINSHDADHVCPACGARPNEEEPV